MQKQITHNQLTIGSAAAVIVLALTMGSEAQAADATGTANATVVTPISIAEDLTMEFGSLAGTPTAGTIVLDTAGARANTNVDLLSGGTIRAAQFTVTGSGTATFSTTLPSTDVTLTSSGDTMTLSAFTSDVASALSGGTETFNVGATLAVGINQSTGAYTGSYTVTVNYN